MNIKEINMQSDLPKEILELEDLFDKLLELECIKFNETFQDIFKLTIIHLKRDKTIKTDNISQEYFSSVFISDLLEHIIWNFFIEDGQEIAKEFLAKLANIIVKYGGCRSIGNWMYEESFSNFWRAYIKLYDEQNLLKFMKKVNGEIRNIVESEDEDKIDNLLPKIHTIFKFFYHMTDEEMAESIEELEKVTVTLINLCIKYKYKLDCLSVTCVPLTHIFEMIQSKEIKNLIIKYLIEYADYFTGLKIDNRECVINTVYSSADKKSEVFQMYLENALLLNRRDLYSGEILDKVLNKLFREISAEKNGENTFFGEDSPEDFLNALHVIEEICNNPDNLKLLLDSDFFDKIYKMFNFFTSKYFREKNPNSKSEYLNQIENKMKLSFFDPILESRNGYILSYALTNYDCSIQQDSIDVESGVENKPINGETEVTTKDSNSIPTSDSLVKKLSLFKKD